jgi:hypothetical protein
MTGLVVNLDKEVVENKNRGGVNVEMQKIKHEICLILRITERHFIQI